MGHHSCCNQQKVKRGLWSPEEDEKLIRYINTHGYGCWSKVPEKAVLKRCGKSCRLRWINYLRPDIRRGRFTPEEEKLIINLQGAVGNRWAHIASHLPGRTDNEIKNYWNSWIKKKIRKTSSTKTAPNDETCSHFLINQDLSTNKSDMMIQDNLLIPSLPFMFDISCSTLENMNTSNSNPHIDQSFQGSNTVIMNSCNWHVNQLGYDDQVYPVAEMVQFTSPVDQSSTCFMTMETIDQNVVLPIHEGQDCEINVGGGHMATFDCLERNQQWIDTTQQFPSYFFWEQAPEGRVGVEEIMPITPTSMGSVVSSFPL